MSKLLRYSTLTAVLVPASLLVGCMQPASPPPPPPPAPMPMYQSAPQPQPMMAPAPMIRGERG